MVGGKQEAGLYTALETNLWRQEKESQEGLKCTTVTPNSDIFKLK